MKFEDALNQAYDEIQSKKPEVLKNGFLSEDGLVTAAAIWNMIAIAQKEKGLDDFVIIRNNSIISFPFEEKAEKKPKPDKGPEDEKDNNKGKGKSPKPATATADKVDAKEKAEKPTPAPEQSEPTE